MMCQVIHLSFSSIYVIFLTCLQQQHNLLFFLICMTMMWYDGMIVSLEEIVDTDLSITSSFGADVGGSNVVHDRVEDSLYRNTLRNRHRSISQSNGYADREHMR